MRKYFLGVLVSVISFSFVSAQTTSCVDISVSLSRGMESANVVKLQNFLYAKGFLKVTPNGYFGGATFAAVKAYQKSVGLSQVGNVGPGTRALLKRDSCSSTQVIPATQTTSSTTNTTQSMSSQQSSVISYPQPTITSLDKGTFFSGGVMEWNTTITGTNFSTTSNTVYFKNRASTKKYTVGTFPSTDGTSLVLPGTIMSTAYSCGFGCKEFIEPGEYNIIVENQGGESNSKYVQVKSFTVTSMTGALAGPIKQNATDTLFGRVAFSATAPIYLVSLTPSVRTEGVDSAAVSFFKDEQTGSAPVFDENAPLYEYQSKILALYGSVTSVTPGTVHGKLTITINDFVGKKPVSFTSPEFMFLVSGY